MRVLGLSLAIAALAVSSSQAAPGDQWIIGIHHIDQAAGFTTFTGAGYSGVKSSGNSSYDGNAYGHTGGAGDISRVYWELSGLSVNTGHTVPTTAELYKVEYYAPTAGGHTDYQVVESQYLGAGGEAYPHDNHIPWAGQFGTNHQWVHVQNFNDANWHTMGPGPQMDTTSPADGTMMWLTSGSWLYAKWDQPFGPTNRSWSALRLTEITPIAGPPVAGDYNKNGTVDAADYALWRKTYGQQGNNLPADGFPDTFIDEYDYDVWREAFGNTSGSGSGSLVSLNAVPEPSTVFLVMLVAGMCFSDPRSGRSAAMDD